ncbi:MAG TPA: TonB-dependent receptor [Acidobacteriaceae bacterium]|nr:TonB-dependent receptor [Acidobacteriaceae bacterium]
MRPQFRNSHLRFTVFLLSLFALATTAVPAAFGQQFQGAITGLVRDPSGAVVSGADVRAVDTGTNVPYETKTNKDGLYNILLLPVGNYDVSVTASGFETSVQHFQLHANDRLEINFSLTLGSATQSVVVTATVPLLETTSGDSGLTVSTQQVHDLPLLGRNPFVLATLAPGINILPGQAPNNSQRPFDNGGFDGFEVNGGRSETVESTIDGLADTATDSGSATGAANIVFVPSPDMTQEFRVQTSVYDAQYGRSGGGFIAMNLRSGTNKLHGTVYDYYRSAGLNANDYADNRNGVSRPPFHWQQPGAEVDGPVYIPHIYDGRNRTFFMFGWEEIRTSQPAPTYSSVPTDLERNGDFSQSLKGGAAAILYDPLTTVQNPNGSYSRQTFPNPSMIPQGRIDPVAQAITALLPHANVPGAGDTNNLYSGPNNVGDAYDAFSYRIDHAVSQNHRLSFVYLYSDRHQTQGLNGFPAAIAPTYLHHRTNYGAHVTWGWTISPTLVSSFGVGWNEHRFAIVNHVPSFDLSTINFPSYMSSASPAPSLFPRISISGYTSFGNANVGTGSLNTSDNFDLRETVIKTLRRHSISFGGEIRPMRDSKQSQAGNSTFTFGKDFTQANPQASDAVSGNGFASFLLGYADGGAASQNPVPRYKNAYYALFVQDSWRTTDNLTLTFGLRWDTESPQIETHGEQNTGFDPSAAYTFAGQNLHGAVLFNSTGSQKAYGWDKNNFGPRVGFSYHAGKSLVLRGGYGVLYSPTWDVPTTVGFSASTAYLASTNNLLTPALPTVLSNPYPTGFLHPAGAATNLNGQGGWSFWANHQRQVPRTRQFSLGIEYQLPANSILEVHYVGQLTDNLPMTRNQNYTSLANLALGNALNTSVPNPFAGQLPGTSLNGATISRQQSLLPYPQYTTFNEIFTNGHSAYNGLQVRYEKRITHGFHYLVSYTYSKNMLTAYLNDQDTYPRSEIDHYDLPHVLTISGGYNLPFFAHSSHVLAREFLSGWSANIIYNYSSGELFGVPSGVQATGVNPHIPNPTRAHFFNTCTITVAGTLQNCVGNEQPAWAINKPFALNNTVPYFGELRTSIPQNVNFSLFKTFPIYEDLALQFRAESFNLTNTPQFGAPDTGVNSATFGSQTNFAQTNNPRNVQLAARLTF